jgi:hypothetical protein
MHIAFVTDNLNIFVQVDKLARNTDVNVFRTLKA